MANAWVDLPNAAHIDAVLAHVKTHPDKWEATRGAALKASCSAAYNAARGAAWAAARDAAWAAARYACLALIAYDYAGAYMTLTPQQLAPLAAAGDPAAVLLTPAITAMTGD